MAKSRPCEICRKPIETDRLESLPETRLCNEHAVKAKKHGGEFIVSTSQERTSKVGSLKRNYGGINVSKRRNLEAIERLKIEFDDEKWQKKA